MSYTFNFVLVVLSLNILCTGTLGSDGGFRDVALARHNYYRERLQVVPLVLDAALNIIAHTHAEKLASTKSFHSSGTGYGDKENLWAYVGTLRPLAVDVTDAINCWYTGSTAPGNTMVSVQSGLLRSNTTRLLGIGVGTSDDYTVVVANYLD